MSVSEAPEPDPQHPMTRAVRLDARLDPPLTAGRVQVREIRMLAGHAAGLHVHDGPVFGSILRGSVVYRIEGEPEVVLRAGDVFHEPAGARIARFDATDQGADFLAYFLLADGAEPGISSPPVDE
jgi:quercetin dioxygenase-like cupin family protein